MSESESPRPVLPADPQHAALIVIPTVASGPVLVPTVARIAADAEGRARQGQPPIALVLAVNTPDPKGADEALHACRGIVDDANSRQPRCLDLSIWREDRPIGFGAANNRGLLHAIATWGGVPELTIFHNDDAHVTGGWIDRLLLALNTAIVHGYSEPWEPGNPRSRRPDHPASQYGRIGLVGPVSNLVAGIQQATAVAVEGGILKWEGRIEQFAAACAERYADQRVTADFLSGFCIGIGREALSDLMLAAMGGRLVSWSELQGAPETWGSATSGTTDEVMQDSLYNEILVGPWDEVQYPIAGFEDNDLCVRAELAGWRCIVAADCFVAHVGHQTFDRLFPDALRGLRNRARYYERWRPLTQPDRDSKLVGIYRLKFEVGHDLLLMRKSIGAAARCCDGFAILLTDNPLVATANRWWDQDQRQLSPEDHAMLQACSGQDLPVVVEAVRAWAEQIAVNAQDSRVLPGQVRVAFWEHPFNERDERNESARMAEDLDADWILSIDHDEVIEDRIRRRHFDRWMRHPDPLVREYDQAWCNHWDSPRLCREDAPWGDEGRYVGGMHGFRLWRLPRRLDGTLAPTRRILAGTPNGLHCGNSPDHDVTAKRVSALRFRHFGYLRVQDRHRKRERYRIQDPDATADPLLTGSRGRDPYAHLIGEEGMRLSPFSPINGIGLHVLVHAGEKVEDLARLLDWLYAVVDRIVLVWTDPWNEADQAWLAPARAEVIEAIAQAEDQRSRWNALGGPACQAPEPPRLRAARSADPLILSGLAFADAPTGPSAEIARMAARFGCEWLHQPLNDDLGAARNAGIEALGADAQGMGWAWFMDLDEHFSDPFANMVAVRRMAETSDSHGWLFTFRNHHRGIEPSRSESVRISRLIPEMRIHGRVHETFDLSVQRIRQSGQEIVIRQAPFLVEHVGLDRDDEDLGRKLRRYQRLLLMELHDNPGNSQAWVSLALHEFNDGRHETGLECLQRAVACAGESYLGYRELAFHHLRVGQALLAGALERSAPGHEFHRAYAPFMKALANNVPTIPILGSAQHGIPTTAPVELPPFPMGAIGALAARGPGV